MKSGEKFGKVGGNEKICEIWGKCTERGKNMEKFQIRGQ